MAEIAQFTIGVKASCSDGTCGEVTRVIVDPVAEALTHLVVAPEHRRGHGKLVPLGLVEATTGQVRLRCTKAEFEKLEPGRGDPVRTGRRRLRGLRPWPGGLLALLRPWHQPRPWPGGRH